MTAWRPRTAQARQRALGSARPGSFLDGLRLSTGTLTALPVPAPASMQPPAPGVAMALAPLIGLIPGLSAMVVALIAGIVGLGPFPAAALGIGMLALTTRGLHLDGLADTADGLASSYDRDRALDVMRRGNTGPAGMATLVLVLLVQVSAATAALSRPGWGTHFGDTLWAASTFVIAAVAGRVAVTLACTRGIPSARSEGLGATVSGSVPIPALIAVAVLASAACTALALGASLPWHAGIVAVLIGLIASGTLVRRTVTRFGGITGDVIGAAVETATAAALLALAAYAS